jgi:hypothetical protein
VDAYLSRDAFHLVSGLIHLSPKPNIDGLLLGHKRGHRFIVENIITTQKGFFSSSKSYLALEDHFQGKLIGFFSFSPDENKIRKILSTFAMGQLLLEVHVSSKRKVKIKSYVIDYKRNFFLSKIPLRMPKA